jgi:hypothetical protein
MLRTSVVWVFSMLCCHQAIVIIAIPGLGIGLILLTKHILHLLIGWIDSLVIILSGSSCKLRIVTALSRPCLELILAFNQGVCILLMTHHPAFYDGIVTPICLGPSINHIWLLFLRFILYCLFFNLNHIFLLFFIIYIRKFYYWLFRLNGICLFLVFDLNLV